MTAGDCTSAGRAAPPAWRSSVYAVLARGFSQPDEAVAEFFRECGDMDLSGGDEISRGVAELIGLARSTPPEEMRSAYMRMIDPVMGPFPYETENTKGHDFARAHVLADIMGFYRAFGVEPDSDRADHIAAELEFMHYLALKEDHALRAGQEENAAVCREAQVKFFHEHLVTWTDELLASLQRDTQREPAPFYEDLMHLLQLFMESEKENLR